MTIKGPGDFSPADPIVGMFKCETCRHLFSEDQQNEPDECPECQSTDLEVIAPGTCPDCGYATSKRRPCPC